MKDTHSGEMSGKQGTCSQHCKQSQYWLRLISATCRVTGMLFFLTARRKLQIFAKKLYQKHLLLRFPNGHFIGSWWKSLGLCIISRSLTPLHVSNIYLLEVGVGYLILLLRKLCLFHMFGIGESCIFLIDYFLGYLILCFSIVPPHSVCVFSYHSFLLCLVSPPSLRHYFYYPLENFISPFSCL